MTALGLDLSLTATGWATTLHDHGVHKPDSRGVERLDELDDWLRYIVQTCKDIVVIEGYSFNSRNSQARAVAEWGGVARLTLWQLDIPFVEISPATLKKWATGRGNATKADMRMALFKRTGVDVADDNEVDAIWLCAAGHQAMGDPLWEMPKVNVEALAKVEWPKVEVET